MAFQIMTRAITARYRSIHYRREMAVADSCADVRQKNWRNRQNS